MIQYDNAASLNLAFKPGDQVTLKNGLREEPPKLYTVDKIIIDQSSDKAAKYFLHPQPTGGAEWYYSHQLERA